MSPQPQHATPNVSKSSQLAQQLQAYVFPLNQTAFAAYHAHLSPPMPSSTYTVTMPYPTSPSPSGYTSSSPASSSPPHAAAGSSRKRVSAEHTLSRVRENQRRHRARRKDYIASLEQKLAETEAQLAAARAELDALHAERDVRVGSLEGEMRARESLQLQMPALERLVDSLPIPLVDSSFTAYTDTPAASLEHVPLSPENDLPLAQAGPPPCCSDPEPVPAPSPECSSCHTRPAPAPTESTTLCAQAYVLIAQQNFRGIDAGTIRLWLYQGYRRARREGEGCRVENGALFRLLDYISGV